MTFIAPQGFGAVEGYTVTHRVVEAPFEGEEKVVTVEDVSDGDTAEDKASDGIDAAESAGTPEGDATAEEGKKTNADGAEKESVVNADGAVGNKPDDVD